MNQSKTKFDTDYEWKAVLLLFLGFGLVGLDRWIIAPLAPKMMQDLGFDTADIAYIIGVLGLSWGVFTMIAGNISDRFGRRRVLLPALLVFSAMSGVTGAVAGLAGLLAIRALMGATEGAYLSTSVALTGEASHPRRRGLNQGLMLSSFSLFGLAFGPIIGTQLWNVFNNFGASAPWRWVFVIVAVPGFILTYFAYRVIRDPARLKSPSARAPAAGTTPSESLVPWTDVFKNRNIPLAMIGILCGMCCVFVLSALIPIYLTSYLHLSTTEMGFVTSGLGFGGFAGSIAMPGAIVKSGV